MTVTASNMGCYGEKHMFQPMYRPTVSIDVTCAVAYTYGCDSGRILPTRCAVIDAALGDRWSPRRAYSKPPAGVGSAHNGLAAASTPVSPVDPDGFHRSRTTPPSATTPCGGATPARCGPDTRPCRPRLC